VLWQGPPSSAPMVLLAWGWNVVYGVLDAALTAALGVQSALYEGTEGVVMGMVLLAERVLVSAGMFMLGVLMIGMFPAQPPHLIMAGAVTYLALIVWSLGAASRRVVGR